MKILIIIMLVLTSSNLWGQKKIEAKDKIVFVYFENQEKNLIVIPNMGKLHKFKIYRKQTNEEEFVLIEEKKRPPLPMRYNVTPYAVTWKDPEYHSREVQYKIVACDKGGNELCEMQIVWEDSR